MNGPQWKLVTLILSVLEDIHLLATALTIPSHNRHHASFAINSINYRYRATPSLHVQLRNKASAGKPCCYMSSSIAAEAEETSHVEQPPRRRLIPQARRPSMGEGSRYRSNDWILNVLSIPRSYLLRRIKSHLIFDQLVCLAVLALHKAGMKISIPLLGHTLLGSFLGLLLVFRTNSAYSRFWDARVYWAKASSTCRSLAMGCVWHLRPHAPKSVAKLEQLLVAFPDVLAYTCLVGVRKARLPQEEWELLYGKQQKEGHVNAGRATKRESKELTERNVVALDPATVILYKMHQYLHEASYETKNPPVIFNFYLSTLGGEVSRLSDVLSGCEKIVQTPVPLSYSRHTSRFLTLWCGFLPFAIVKDLGWLSIPVMGTVSWLLYGLEEIGHLIEQPFVPVTERPTYLISDDEEDSSSVKKNDDRASKTMPYDIGLPVCSVAERIRLEVEKIISLR
ncbi:hypothetical protein HJC23_006193 [Cyclotella cryptica]|uniref:Bestrophin homolog n=1 Tax=Cyclotella cryptica TaxID=29204 RepID=A0ABD3PX09_9STRA|eukprot:CCRYP_010812-RA/>CCRYP_010812-RA protein AED:0.00 eAED:0.00 QI:147/1/1/1/0/0/2/971/451